MADFIWWIERADGGGQRFPLRRAVRIGRAPDNDIVLTSPQASRYHCTVSPAGDQCTVDARSASNGIRVGGQRVNQATLQNGQEFSVGGERFRVIHAPAPVGGGVTPLILVPLIGVFFVGVITLVIFTMGGNDDGGAPTPVGGPTAFPTATNRDPAGGSNDSNFNVVASTDRASYRPGDIVVVTITNRGRTNVGVAWVGEMFYIDGSPVGWWNADDNVNFNKTLIQPGESSTWKMQLADGQRFDQPARPGTAYVEFLSAGPGNDTNAARKIRTPNFAIQ